MIEIRQVKTKADLREFASFPHQMYKGNPYWCPPLLFDEMRILDRKKNAAFEICEAEYWLAYKDGKPAGRIAGIINPRANQRWNELLGRFGWIDFIDDDDVSAALIRTAEEWSRSKGMIGIHGPFGFTDMDNEGMMIEGFDQPCTLSSIYNHPYYQEHMQRMGFEKAVDWIQYEFEISPEVPEKVERTARIVEEKYHLRMLRVKKSKDLIYYGKKMFLQVNQTFDDLYGFSALSPKQIDAYIKQYFSYIRPEFVAVVLDTSDQVVGFGISMPSLTRALQKSNGRLFPFGWLYILKALKTNDVIDMILVGVDPEYQGKGAAAMIWRELHKAYLKYGIKKAISNPQLEDNSRALTIWKNFTGRQIIRRRCWIRHF